MAGCQQNAINYVHQFIKLQTPVSAYKQLCLFNSLKEETRLLRVIRYRPLTGMYRMLVTQPWRTLYLYDSWLVAVVQNLGELQPIGGSLKWNEAHPPSTQCPS